LHTLVLPLPVQVQAGVVAGAPVQLHDDDPEQNVCATPPSLTSSLSQQPL
jgi:hypothetical protein